MRDINIKFIPQEEQRIAGQIGDYWETSTSIEFRITRLDNPAHSMAVLLHELHEKFRNDQLGVPDADVDEFDITHPELDDPGLSSAAPYHKAHMEADALERLFIILTGNEWNEYENAVNALFGATPCQ
jgi:hypothetical protein